MKKVSIVYYSFVADPLRCDERSPFCADIVGGAEERQDRLQLGAVVALGRWPHQERLPHHHLQVRIVMMQGNVNNVNLKDLVLNAETMLMRYPLLIIA